MFDPPSKRNSSHWGALRNTQNQALISKTELQTSIENKNEEGFNEVLKRRGNLSPDSFHDVFGCLLNNELPNEWIQQLLNKFDNDSKRRFLENEIAIVGRHANESDSDSSSRVALSLTICKALLNDNPRLMDGNAVSTKRNIMHVAAQANAFVIIEEIRKVSRTRAKALVLEVDQNNKSAIELAIEHGHIETLKEMAGDDRTVLNMTNGGKTALAKTAIFKNHIHVLKYLLADDVEAITMEVISLAVRQGSIRIFQFLVEQRPSLLEQEDCCLLTEAVECNHFGLVKRLVKLRPNLVGGYRTDPVDPMEPPRQVLSYAKRSDEEGKIYDFLLPIIIERSEVSDIRQHLLGLSSKYIYSSSASS